MDAPIRTLSTIIVEYFWRVRGIFIKVFDDCRMNRTMDEKEELVKKALFSFVRKQVPTAQLRYSPTFIFFQYPGSKMLAVYQ